MDKTEALEHKADHSSALAPQAPPSFEAVREALDRVLSSKTFRTAEGQRNFLRYAVEQVLEGRGDLLKEYSVGIEVFGRGESFDPRLDTIVRTEARKLRSRLAKYYETEGAEEAVHIEFPKGSYAPIFRSAPATAPIAISVPPPPTPTVAARPVFSRKAIVFLTAGVALAAFAAYLVQLAGRSAAPRSDVASIAVLPFLNLSDNKQEEFFSDGLTEELIDSLARVPGLHVVARTSVFQYKDKPIDVRKIGQQLNVRTVLEGSVRKDGDRLRITAQLNDASNGYHLWSQSYDRELKDTLAIQREISQAITDALGVKLASKATPAGFNADVPATLNPEAYQDYLKGRYFLSKYTEESNRTAIGYFEAAISKDPVYAPAYAGLADCYVDEPVYGATLPHDLIPKIRAAASKALELDPAIGEAHIDLALAFEYNFEWQPAAEEFRKGLEFSSGDAIAHRWYANYLLTTGQFDRAMSEGKRALELDPVSPYMAQGVARAFYHMHRFDDAIREFQKALALEPNFGRTLQGLGRAYLAKGSYSQGISETEKGVQVMGHDSVITAQLGYAYAVNGNTAGAQQILDGFFAQLRRGPFSARAIAEVYIGLKDKDRAFEWLRKSVDQKEVNMYLKTDPIYDSLRSDPRFADLLRRANLI